MERCEIIININNEYIGVRIISKILFHYTGLICSEITEDDIILALINMIAQKIKEKG